MSKLIRYLYINMLIVILLLMFFVDTFVRYETVELKKIPNIIILLFLILLFVLMKKIPSKSKKRLECGLERYYYKFLLIGSVLFLIVQLWVAHHIYFFAGWDCKIVTDTAQAIAENKFIAITKQYASGYFSMYPNNITIMLIFSKILYLFQRIGIHEGYFGLIVLGICVINLTGFITAEVSRKIVGEKKYGILAWIMFSAWIGILPWMVIPYSDVFSLIFPIFIIACYVKTWRSCYMKWIFIGIVSGIGLVIKPTTLIVLIAIVIKELISLFNKREVRQFLTKLVLLSGAFFVIFFCNKLFQKNTNKYLAINNNESFSMMHYVMMGLNEEHTGCYLKQDRDFSASYEKKADRQKANLKVIKNRLNDYGVVGYGKFLVKKLLVNYNNGTMGWGKEGNFVYKESDVSKTKISNLLRQIFYPDGEHYSILINYAQAFWLLILIYCVYAACKNRNVELGTVDILFLTIIGITLFTLIFEARSRYLYIMAPIYIVVACYGMRNYRK